MTAPPSPPPDPARTRSGFIAAAAACGVWGVSPLFFLALAMVPPHEVVAHRIVWSALAVGVILALRGQMPEVIAILRRPKALLVFVGSAFTVTLNWLVFVHAVTTGQTLQASLGYYVLPLVSVVLGAVFLKERFSRRQGVALGLVVAGVAVLVVGLGTVPWISLVLSTSFAIYGLLRKIAPTESLVGLFVETLIVLPFAFAFLVWMEADGVAAFPHQGAYVAAMLVIGTPVMTALPLFLYTFGARRLRLSTVGLMFYLNPTIQFLLATIFLRETFTTVHAMTFGLIWAGIIVYSWPRRRAPWQTEPTARY